MRPRHILSLALLLLAAVAARAQEWYGNVDMAGGGGWMKSLRGELLEGQSPYIGHGLGEGNVGFGYKSPKFQWSAGFKGRYEPKQTERYRLEAKSRKEEEEDLNLHARVQKKFKNFTIYFQGKDLLEHMQKNEYVSVYGDNMWVEQIYQNRRLLLLGFNWNFKL